MMTDANAETGKEDNEKNLPISSAASRQDEDYPRGLTFILVTIGLMFVVLILALDNYIIGKQGLILHRSNVLRLRCSYRYSQNYNRVQGFESRWMVRQLLLFDTYVLPAGFRTAMHHLPC